MKKILFISFITLFLTSFAITLSAIRDFKNINEKYRYYYGNISHDFYDLKTFKYDKTRNLFSIDIFHWIEYWHSNYQDIKSPYDKNSVIYIIFGTEYYPETNKIKISYKGFVSGVYKNNKYKEINVYYNNNIFIKEINNHIMELEQVLSPDKNLKYYFFRQDVTKDIYKAFETNKLKNLKYFKENLEEF